MCNLRSGKLTEIARCPPLEIEVGFFNQSSLWNMTRCRKFRRRLLLLNNAHIFNHPEGGEGKWCSSWFRLQATKQKVAISITDGVIDLNTSDAQ